MFDETVYQKADDGTRFIELLQKKNIIPGIKVDRDVVPLFLSEDEVTTQGLCCLPFAKYVFLYD